MLNLLRSKAPEILVAWTGFALLIALILVAPHRLILDEPSYLQLVDQINREGLGVYFLRTYSFYAGPLYVFVHYAAEPLTHLQTPWIRLINPLLFLGAVRLYSTHAKERSFGWNFLGCPFIGMSIAAALTEMPAFFCVCATLLLFLQAREITEQRPLLGWSLALIAGLCFGLAILGRQTYAIALPLFALLINSPRQIANFLGFAAAAFLVFMPIFWIWGGPLPPIAQQTAGGISVEHGLLAFAYAGFAVLFLAPRFLVMPWRWAIGLSVSAVIFNLIVPVIAYAPGIGLTSRLFTMSVLPLHILVCSAPLLVVSVLMMAACVRAGWKFRHDRVYLFYLATSVLLMAECAKMVTTFSSRYIVCILPFLLFVLRPYFDEGKPKAWRFAAAALINAAFPLAYWYL